MAWLKLNNREMFDELKGRYSRSLSKVYDAEFREVMETVKAILQPLSKDKGKPGALRHAGSNSSLNREGSKRSIGGGGGGGGGADSNPADSSSSSTLSSIAATLGSSVATLDNVFEKVLDALEPMVDSEETFCQAFFDLQPSVQQQTSTLTSSVMSTVSDDCTILSVDSGDSRQSLTRQEGKQELDELLKQIFSSAVSFLDALASACHSVSAEFSMQMLVRSADRSDRQSGRGRHLGYLYAQLCLRAKQRFDQFIDQIPRCGVVAPVLSYEKFASRAGPVFRDSKRLPDLERAHEKLLETLVNLVERGRSGARENTARCENFHRLESIVRSQRMQRLDRMRRDLSDRHKQNRTEYVRNYMGRPLEKLSEFFDGVEQNLSRGVTPDEVGYLQQYSRAELKKIIRDYPAKDVKRNLEQLRKRVEKHLSEEGSLLTAVWHEMQQTLLAQYNQFNRLIAQCYPMPIWLWSSPIMICCDSLMTSAAEAVPDMFSLLFCNWFINL
uniref:Sec3_C domain-containing protein n=1 Tax=Macrostomum lignano TaxID=282301 RepID=A0A1I8J8V2_9PLAT